MRQVKVVPNDDGIRPAGPPDACFYCGSKVGEFHGAECVVVQKRVKVRYTYEIEIDVPRDWDVEAILFQRNGGSWCADNSLQELTDFLECVDCLCPYFKAEVIDMGDGEPTQDSYVRETRK